MIAPDKVLHFLGGLALGSWAFVAPLIWEYARKWNDDSWPDVIATWSGAILAMAVGTLCFLFVLHTMK